MPSVFSVVAFPNALALGKAAKVVGRRKRLFGRKRNFVFVIATWRSAKNEGEKPKEARRRAMKEVRISDGSTHTFLCCQVTHHLCQLYIASQ
jgi:hypothetical protein